MLDSVKVEIELSSLIKDQWTFSYSKEKRSFLTIRYFRLCRHSTSHYYEIVQSYNVDSPATNTISSLNLPISEEVFQKIRDNVSEIVAGIPVIL